ncbi:MAG TPA: hypothetical protein VEB19_03505 [Gemmatimonadaceae bacterium]|nr:hypothetical protein [Gemmatimonadaceae bacterium]
MTTAEFFPPRSRILVGIAIVLVSAGLTYGRWYAAEQPIRTLRYFEANRSPGDSAGYASALYHASPALREHANRWTPLGYGTTGIIGILFGAGMLVTALRRNGGA